MTHARASAAQAISAIFAPDETKDYDYMPFFYSRIFDLSWQVSSWLLSSSALRSQLHMRP